jgi:ABC-2 type transport system permease protein
MRRILFLAQAEVLHVVRDRAMLAQVLLVPVIQLLVLGSAATFEIRNTPTWIVDLDQSASSRELVSHLAGSGHFDLVGGEPSLEKAGAAMLAGQVTLVVMVPEDFERDLVRTGRAEVDLTVDAVRGSAAAIVQSYASRVIAAYAASYVRHSSVRPSYDSSYVEPNVNPSYVGPNFSSAIPNAPADLKVRATYNSPPTYNLPRIEVRTRNRYNPSLNYPHYMVPGILVGLVTMIGTLLTAQNIAREKELGTLEQLNVTPITRGQFIAGKLLPYWLLGIVELCLGLLAAKLVFDLPIRGSLLVLLLSAAIYLLVALGIGLLISTRVETQQQAMFVSFFIVNIYLLMSGLFTPIDSMAPWVQQVSYLNPVRHFVTISRAVLVKGAGLAEVAEPLTVLAAFAVVVLAVAVMQYRKRAV